MGLEAKLETATTEFNLFISVNVKLYTVHYTINTVHCVNHTLNTVLSTL